MSKSKKPPANYAPETCASCKGSGAGAPFEACSVCDGQGSVLVAQPAHNCARCAGMGKDKWGGPCEACGGSGWAYTWV